MAKDQLARGAKRATYGQGGIGESPLLRKIAEGESVDSSVYEGTVAPEIIKPIPENYMFIPAGATLLVRQEEAEDPAGVKTFTDQASALNDKSEGLVIIRDEEEKKQEAPAQGWVIAAGPNATFGPDDHIVFGKYSGAAFKLNGEWLLLMQNSDVLGTLEKAA